LGLLVVASTIRCYIRFLVQHEIGWDDVLFLFGFLCLISGITILFTIIDDIYELQGIIYGLTDLATIETINISITIDRIQRYRMLSAVSLNLLCLSISCVKLCFLAFFKKLIRQMPTMITFWWVVLAFNVIVIIYGIIIDVSFCPFSKETQMNQASEH